MKAAARCQRSPRRQEVFDHAEFDRPGRAEPFEQPVTAMVVQAALARLSPEYQEVIVEMYFHGRQVAEIAQSLGVPTATVKSRAYYAIRNLKCLLPAVKVARTPASAV